MISYVILYRLNSPYNFLQVNFTVILVAGMRRFQKILATNQLSKYFPVPLAMLLASFFALPATAQPVVAVSIAPVHSLVAGVMSGVAEPILLIPATRSPHIQPLTPSAIKTVSAADLVIRIGAGYEVALEKISRNLQTDNQLELITAPSSIMLLTTRSGEDWEPGHNEHQNDEYQNDAILADSAYLHTDPHIWLSAYNAAQIVKLTRDRLIRIDSANTSRYISNSNSMLERLASFQMQLQRSLATIKKRPYVVLHDAYQYFENEYHLTVIGSVSVDAQRKPGARRIRRLKDKIAKSGVTCIFLEPQLSSSMVDTLANDMGISVGRLDPLGSDLDAGAQLWFGMMNNLAASLTSCLDPG